MKRIIQNIADYFRETDKVLLLFSIIASLFGCALVYSATRYTDSSRQFWVQLISLAIGVVAAIFISTFDYRSISKGLVVYIALAIGLLGVTYLFGYTPEGSENKAWLQLPFGMSLQVSELIKVFFIITFSVHAASLQGEKIKRVGNVLLLMLHGITPAALIMVFQKDLGTATVMLVIFIVMLFVSGVQLRYFAIGGLVIAAAIPFIWNIGLSEYQRERFSIILNLESDAQGLGYQQLQGLKAIGSGGLTGYGYLQGPKTQTLGVPKAYNDFIFTAAGEELGLIGCVVVLLVLTLLLIRIVYIGSKSRDKQGKIICMGIFGMFAAQIMINLGMVLALLPVIGVTLPFFSAGGTSLLCLFLSIGLALSVYKHRNLRQISLR